MQCRNLNSVSTERGQGHSALPLEPTLCFDLALASQRGQASSSALIRGLLPQAAMFLKAAQAELSMRLTMALICCPGPSSCIWVLPAGTQVGEDEQRGRARQGGLH